MADAPPLLLSRRLEFAELTANADRAPWKGVDSTALREVTTGAGPEQATSVRTGYDSAELRVLFCAIDSEPWATLKERDAPIYTEETVEIFLDPAGDLNAYFEIEVNPLNAVLDLVVRRSRGGWTKDIRWRCDGLQTFVRRTAEGWNAEIAIPFGAVHERAPAPHEKWRVNFCRIDRPPGKPRELSAWSPTGLPQFHVPSCFGTIEFI